MFNINHKKGEKMFANKMYDYFTNLLVDLNLNRMDHSIYNIIEYFADQMFISILNFFP
jgi:flagellin-specific chaperone FliS